jgi:hypothetical protein
MGNLPALPDGWQGIAGETDFYYYLVITERQGIFRSVNKGKRTESLVFITKISTDVLNECRKGFLKYCRISFLFGIRQ